MNKKEFRIKQLENELGMWRKSLDTCDKRIVEIKREIRELRYNRRK